MSVVEEEITLPVVPFKRQRVGIKVEYVVSSRRFWSRFRMHLQLKKTQNSKSWLHVMFL